MKTYLSNKQIERLANIFADEKRYTEHLATLWALRESLSIKMGYPYVENTTHPLFNLFDLTNELIGAIDNGTISISNGQIRLDRKYKIDW